MRIDSPHIKCKPKATRNFDPLLKPGGEGEYKIRPYAERPVGAILVIALPFGKPQIQIWMIYFFRGPKAARIRFVWLNANVKRDSMHPLEAAVIFEETATFFNESGEVLSELLATLEFANCHLLAGNHSEVNMTVLALKRFVFKDTSQLVKTVIMNVYRAGIEDQNNDFATTLMGALGAVKAAVENATAANPN